ncbi:hypothetical protein GCM10010978_23990 [Compostibacillus humi]|uniref:Uncharacterized protein n=1 Tax=Compostibacillus humi TaxID=1245525 RepID=A0A8J2TQV4_9BACI|nr:hypothetical protein GCM10010978_23990 [Compostibacillus humi]
MIFIGKKELWEEKNEEFIVHHLNSCCLERLQQFSVGRESGGKCGG